MTALTIQKRYYRVNQRDICFIRYVFEAHDGLAVITTPSKAKDMIVLRIAPGCVDDALSVVEGLKQELVMDELSMENVIAELEDSNA